MSWKEGRVWDLWMIVHFLTGTVIGFANVFLGLSTTTLYFGALVGMILWEIIEIFNGVKESDENRVMDILFGLLGLFAATRLASVLPTLAQHAAFYLSALALGVGCFFGWRAYQKREGFR